MTNRRGPKPPAHLARAGIMFAFPRFGTLAAKMGAQPGEHQPLAEWMLCGKKLFSVPLNVQSYAEWMGARTRRRLL
jgi:hypothetical protein